NSDGTEKEISEDDDNYVISSTDKWTSLLVKSATDDTAGTYRAIAHLSEISENQDLSIDIELKETDESLPECAENESPREETEPDSGSGELDPNNPPFSPSTVPNCILTEETPDGSLTVSIISPSSPEIGED
ncbi:hypothetical protein, partial [Salmonella sp. s51228]|uniref:hypothetical protein n=1 Tax=Salmonella sp. s51228 TaxID=3159652 RepID=UPI0039803079